MRTRTIAAAVGLLSTLTACDMGSEDSEPTGLTARGMVDELGDLFPLPHPRDNSGACDTGKDNPDDCRQLITTDPVSVYELKTEASAANWTNRMDGVGKNQAIQAGRFMLLWKADYPSDKDAVAKMMKKAQDLAAADQ